MNLFTRTFSKIFKSSNQQELDKIQNIIEAINNKENELSLLQRLILRKRHLILKKILKMDLVKFDEIIPESFALVREAAKRTLG